MSGFGVLGFGVSGFGLGFGFWDLRFCVLIKVLGFVHVLGS